MSTNTRRSDWSKRCPRCWLPFALCLCAEATPHALKTRLIILMDQREAHQTTNTSHLALLALSNAEVHLYGRHDRERDVKDLHPASPDHVTWLLFPGDDARILTPDLAGAASTTLVVPDATWRTASRMVRKIPLISALPRVTLPPGPPPICWLRQPPRDAALSTMEALARAFGILEGPEIQADMERLLLLMVERYRQTRG